MPPKKLSAEELGAAQLRSPCICGSERFAVVPAAAWSMGNRNVWCKRCDLYQGWEMSSAEEKP